MKYSQFFVNINFNFGFILSLVSAKKETVVTSASETVEDTKTRSSKPTTANLQFYVSQ